MKKIVFIMLILLVFIQLKSYSNETDSTQNKNQSVEVFIGLGNNLSELTYNQFLLGLTGVQEISQGSLSVLFEPSFSFPLKSDSTTFSLLNLMAGLRMDITKKKSDFRMYIDICYGVSSTFFDVKEKNSNGTAALSRIGFGWKNLSIDVSSYVIISKNLFYTPAMISIRYAF